MNFKDVLLYEPTTGKVSRRYSTSGAWWKAGCKYHDKEGRVSVKIQIDKKIYPLQNVVFAYMTGDLPKESVVFLDGDRTNFKWDNLRLRSQAKRVAMGHKNCLDRRGQKIGALTILEEAEYFKGRHWLCRCQCGKEVVVKSTSLRHKKTCGCSIPGINMKHGASHSTLYKKWNSMKCRCYRKSSKHYPAYGGRGIRVCERWRDFQAFYEDMSPTFEEGLTIERIDVNGDYEPSNCRWATMQEQSLNTRRSKLLTLDGVTKNASIWAIELGFSRALIYKRIKLGWDDKRILTEPSRYDKTGI